MPHGAMDIYIIHQVLKSKKLVALCLLTYIAIALPILFFWPLYPTSCFLFFLSYSLIHFADSDMQDSNSTKKVLMIEFLARVNLPFCLPFIFHNEDTLRLVKWIHPGIDLHAFSGLIQGLGYFSLVLVAVNTLLGVIAFLKSPKEADVAFLEPVVISVLFIFVNPLFALGIYFCFIHSLKHLVNVLLKVKIHSPLTILPYWLFPLAGIPILFFIYSKNQIKLGENIFQYILIVLSSLALPHALLVRYGKAKRIIN